MLYTTRLVRRLGVGVAVLGGAALAGCSYSPAVTRYPAAALTDYEAARVADGYQVRHNVDYGVPVRMEKMDWGYKLTYETPFDRRAVPPKEVHVLAVDHDGAVMEWALR